jgi:hypothetical protein
MILADVSFNTETLAVMGTVAGTLWGALVFMWRSDVQRRDRENTDLREQRDDMFRVIVENGLKRELPQRTLRRVDPGEAERRDQESGERPH